MRDDQPYPVADLSDGPEDSDLDLDLAPVENLLTPARLGWSLLVLGLVGFAASLALSIEKVLKLADPDHVASCSINIFLDCSVAMGSWQGALLGFPNSFVGVAAFPVVVTTGVVLLTGARLPRWYWLSLFTGVVVACGLVVFLVHTSVSVLGKLCPYCMVVWVAVLPLVVHVGTYVVQERFLPAPERLRAFLVANRSIVVVVLYVLVIVWVAIGLGPAIADHVRYA
ncbi:vitamin K epoxide reductase family protein [Sanguibacter antarcticus]|uniref:Putative membrane protein n=1 Tax=Sanguibacter antarcticus TaxID=372484 RepID=A0A2A9E1Q6_9MICO|nr:vitamin K epoxide reductase family protein [Sanguibacter antarcticus]PFG32773.1 putative membrane protein [Sanguibacter antarcticus]